MMTTGHGAWWITRSTNQGAVERSVRGGASITIRSASTSLAAVSSALPFPPWTSLILAAWSTPRTSATSAASDSRAAASALPTSGSVTDGVPWEAGAGGGEGGGAGGGGGGRVRPPAPARDAPPAALSGPLGGPTQGRGRLGAGAD